jgi:hypothetical protein
MKVKFKITYDDNTTIESHDELFNPQFDHAHALAPNNTKRWKEYQLITDNGHSISVDFTDGTFRFDSIVISPIDHFDGDLMTAKTDSSGEQVEETSGWSVNNDSPYFPIAGRRVYKGDFYGAPIDEVVYYCGWKRKKGDRTVTKIAYIYPNGGFGFT